MAKFNINVYAVLLLMRFWFFALSTASLFQSLVTPPLDTALSPVGSIPYLLRVCDTFLMRHGHSSATCFVVICSIFAVVLFFVVVFLLMT